MAITAGGIGRPLPRADGRAKVTGAARYVAEFPLPGLLNAVFVESPAPRGRLTAIDTDAATAAPGVVRVFTHRDMPRLQPAATSLSQTGAGGSSGQPYVPLQDDRIHYAGQHIALVVAETWEQATYAASLVRPAVEREPPVATWEASLPEAFRPQKIWGSEPDTSAGDADAGLAAADVRVDATYGTPIMHHCTMEPHATTAVWDGDRLTVYEPSTWPYGVRHTVAAMLGVPEEHVRVVQEFVGGSFGCKGPTWPHVALIAAAARALGRPLRLVLTRRQTFTSNGYRPEIRQRVRLGARADGTLTAVVHDAEAQTAAFDDRVVAPVTKTTRKLYACPNVRTTYRLVRWNLSSPFTMRGPGETPGLFALESALDELAYALGMDPVALRLKNYAEKDPETGKPWASKSLRQCYREGAKRFGWEKRTPAPRSMRHPDGRLLGMGMATMAYDAKSSPTSARAVMDRTGQVVVQSATCDQGTGSYTVMRQVAADALGVPVEQIRFELGDTALPRAPISAGSQTMASVGSAVQVAAQALRAKLIVLAAADPSSPLAALTPDRIGAKDGRLYRRDASRRGETYAAIVARQPGGQVEAAIDQVQPAPEGEEYTGYSFGAHFAEVAVDEVTGETQVTRWVAAFGAGRIVNPLTARSQLIGGIVWGIGMALSERTLLDPRLGRFANADLAEYLVPVNADIPDGGSAIDAFFVPETDPHVNLLGVKGVGEIGTIGAPAAVANAVYHATGVRIRDLPITLDKLL